jgi:hypothetical protein
MGLKLIANERPIVFQGWSRAESLMREQREKLTSILKLPKIHDLRAHFATLHCEKTITSFIKAKIGNGIKAHCK